MSQKHIGRDSPREISGPVSGAKIDRMLNVTVSYQKKKEVTSDAAVWAADPKMRF